MLLQRIIISVSYNKLTFSKILYVHIACCVAIDAIIYSTSNEANVVDYFLSS